MKKTYICPNMLAVKLNTKSNILTMSREGQDTTNITFGGNSGTEISDQSGVWTKESKNVWDNEW